MKKAFLITAATFFLGTFALDKTLVAAPVLQQAQLPPSDPSQVDTPGVKLLNPGAEPREELRFKVDPSSLETTKVTSKMDITMSFNGQPSSKINTPVTDLTMDLRVTKVEENGDVYADFVYTDVQVRPDANTPPELLESVKAQTNQMIGLKGSVVFDNRGNVKSYEIALPENLDPNLKEYLQSTIKSVKGMSNPLPAEPVGVGAQWETTTFVNSGGVNIKQIDTYSLVAVKDDQVLLDVVIEQQANPQPINSPGLPTGVTANLVSLQGKGQGKIVLNLNKVMPQTAEIQTTSDSKMRVTQSGNTQEALIDNQSTLNLKIETRW